MCSAVDRLKLAVRSVPLETVERLQKRLLLKSRLQLDRSSSDA